VPGHVHRDLRHDGVGEAERRGEELELFDGIGDETGVLQPRRTLRAGTDVRLERSNAKTLLVVEEEVDLGREKVTVIHGEVYAMVRDGVSERKTEFSRKFGLG
jgi:hypothetical protein